MIHNYLQLVQHLSSACDIHLEGLSMFSSGTNKGVCNMIHTRPSFHSLSFGYLPQPAHMKAIRQVVKTIQRKW